jgi:hypothetical protein
MLRARREQAEANVYADEWKPKPRDAPANDYVSVKVAGESQYQESLRQICGRKGNEAIRLEGKKARLVPEPDNPHDSCAVRVEIDGMTVGYMSRGNARLYHKRVAAMIEDGEHPIVDTWIGCHGPEAENPNIGVRLKIPRDSRLEQPLR